MNKFTSQEKIISSILDGIEKAKKEFLFWSNGRLSLSFAPKDTVTIYISQEIAKISNTPEIYINASVSDILRCSLPKRDQSLKFMNDRNLKEGTFCITLDERLEHKDDNDSISKVIISVMDNVINSKPEYLDEIERICKMIATDENYKTTTLDYGVFSFYSELSQDARKKLNKRIPELIKNFDKIVAKYDMLKATFIGGEIEEYNDDTQWSMGCYVIEPFYK